MSTDGLVPTPQGEGNILEKLNDPRDNNLSGPVQLTRDPHMRTITGPQIIQIPMSDSLLQKTSPPQLTPHRVRCLKRDPTIALIRELIVSPAIATPWTYEETKDAPEGAKEEIEEMMECHRLMFLQSSFLGTIDFGWAPFELVWEIEDGNVKLTKFKQLLHDWTWILIYLDTGSFAGFTNNPMTGDEVHILGDKALNVNLEVEGTDWYGISSLEKANCVDSWWDTVNKSAGRFDRKIAGANWVLHYPQGIHMNVNGQDTTSDEIARGILAALEANSGVAIPSEISEVLDDFNAADPKRRWEIELVSASGNSATHFTDRLKYLDTLKVRAFGLTERSILEGKFGTKAEAETHADASIMNIDRKHRIIVEQANKGPVNTYLRNNYGMDAESTVKIVVSPLNNSRINMLREVYSRVLQQPETLLHEFDRLDMKALTDQLAIPSQPNAQQTSPLEEKQEMVEKMNQQKPAFGGQPGNSTSENSTDSGVQQR